MSGEVRFEKEEEAEEVRGLRVISYGGGVQSTALLVLAAQGKIDFDLALFANTGDDSEHPASLDYVRNVATPFAYDFGIDVVEVCRRYADGRPYPSLRSVMTDPDRMGVPIPMFLVGERGSGPNRRTCTYSWKVDVLMKEITKRGATAENPATIAIGISVDEIERAGRGINNPMEHRTYPLLDLGLNRGDCEQLIRDAGLPVPRKSACYFCPYHSPLAWRELRRDEPDLFADAVALERAVNDRQEAEGRVERYWLSSKRKPLDEATRVGEPTLFGVGSDGCDEGVCFT